MLINYSFANFRSFKNKTLISMMAGSQRTLNENLIRIDGLRILPSTVIYGANNFVEPITSVSDTFYNTLGKDAVLSRPSGHGVVFDASHFIQQMQLRYAD